MTWKYRISWRVREKRGGTGGSLPGLYDYFEAVEKAAQLRKDNPDKLFWINQIKAHPTSDRDVDPDYRYDPRKRNKKE